MAQQEPVGPTPENNSSPTPTDPMGETKTTKRSTASSLIGLVYAVYFGLGLISSTFGMVGALASWSSDGLWKDALMFAFTAPPACIGYALYKRKSWARQAMITLNFIIITLTISAVLIALGFAFSLEYSGDSSMGALFLIVGPFVVFPAVFTVALAAFTIFKLRAEASEQEPEGATDDRTEHIARTFE